ncbi:MAG TPA: S41 family peptidase [Candidatus Saccharimonadales bacterium]|nr:S41 family peptidase [Candidatus Saccharimonadales bacterium]
MIVSYLIVAIIFFGFGYNAGGKFWFTKSTQNSSLPSQLNYSSVNQLYQLLKSNYDGKLTEQQLVDGMKNGLIQSTNDPYTEYFTASQASSFNNELNGSFSGIGAQLGLRNNNLTIVSPLAGFPAQKAGLQAGDIILSINGVSTTNMNIDVAVNDIRGPKGTTVDLKILRGNQSLDFKIVRQDITVPSVTWSVNNGIGDMVITQFANDTAGLANKAAQDFTNQHVKGIILDLRGDGGGYLQAGVDVASLWLPQGTEIVQERAGSTVLNSLTSTGDDTLHGIPTAVLVDGGTASASEIVSGALRDNNAATLIGSQTFGKGVVQQIFNLTGGSEVKITVAKWYTPNGQNINHQGLTPKIVVPMTTSDVNSGQDPQKARAVEFLQTGR